MPFVDYRDFADCVSRNGDKDSPESYCGAIKRDTEDKQDGPAEQPDRQLTLAVSGATIASMESVVALHDTPKSKHKDHGPKGKGGGEVKQSRLTRRKSPGGTDLGYYVDVEELGQRYDVQDGEGYGWEITSRGWTDSNEAREGKVEWTTGRTSFKNPEEAERWISALDEVVQRHAGKDYGFGNSSSPRIQVEVSEDGKTAKVKEYDWGRWEDTAALQGDGGVKKHKDSLASTEAVISLHDTPKSKHKDHGPKGKGNRPGEFQPEPYELNTSAVKVSTFKKPMKVYTSTDEEAPIISTNEERLIPESLSTSRKPDRVWGKNVFELTLPEGSKVGEVDSIWDLLPPDPSKVVDTPMNIGQRLAGFARENGIDVLKIGDVSGVGTEYAILNEKFLDSGVRKGDRDMRKHKDSQGSTEHHKRAGAPKLDPESSNRGGGAATRDAKKDARSLYRRLDRDVQDAFKEQFKDAASSQDSSRMQNVLDRWTEDPYGAGLRGGTTSLSRALTRESLASTEAVISLHDTPNTSEKV